MIFLEKDSEGLRIDLKNSGNQSPQKNDENLSSLDKGEFMTQTNDDGEKPDTPKDGEKSRDPKDIVPFPKNGAKENAADGNNSGNETEKKNPSIGIDKDKTFIEIRIPLQFPFWSAMGFIHEILIPHIRAIYLEKAQKSAFKDRLIKPNQKGWRGFNPFK